MRIVWITRLVALFAVVLGGCGTQDERVPNAQPATQKVAGGTDAEAAREKQHTLRGTLAVHDGDQQALLAHAPLVFGCDEFFVRSGMGQRNPYYLGRGITTAAGKFEFTFPSPAHGSLSRITVCVYSEAARDGPPLLPGPGQDGSSSGIFAPAWASRPADWADVLRWPSSTPASGAAGANHAPTITFELGIHGVVVGERAEGTMSRSRSAWAAKRVVLSWELD